MPLSKWPQSAHWNVFYKHERTQSRYRRHRRSPECWKIDLAQSPDRRKISIVSRKAQTTRHRIMGILTRPDAQYVFVDTPGFQTRHVNALNRTMNRVVTQALAEVDVVVLVIDADRVDVNDQTVFNLLIHNCPVILAINKLDRLKDKARLLPMIANLAEQYSFAAIVPISAAKGSQLDVLLTEIRKLLPGSELLFDEDEITDKSERFRRRVHS